MKTKVKSVQQDGTWQGKDGTMFYKHEYQFEDGVVMQASHKKVSPFNVGDEVEYVIKKDDPTYGKSGTVGKPQEGGYSSGYKKQSGSNASFALSYAKDWCLGLHNAGEPKRTADVLAAADVFNKWLKENAG